MIGREKPGEQSEVAQLIQQTLEQERWQKEMMEQRYSQYMEEDEEVRGSQCLCPKWQPFPFIVHYFRPVTIGPWSNEHTHAMEKD